MEKFNFLFIFFKINQNATHNAQNCCYQEEYAMKLCISIYFHNGTLVFKTTFRSEFKEEITRFSGCIHMQISYSTPRLITPVSREKSIQLH